MIRVATYNIHHGATVDGAPSLARVCAVLADHKADVVCVQELDRRFGSRSGFVDQPTVIAEELGMEAHVVATVRRAVPEQSEPGEYGHGVFSRWPMTRRVTYRMPSRGEPRVALACDIATPDGPVTVVAAHTTPGRATAIRAAQIRQLAAIATSAPHPVIVAGDLNTASIRELDPLNASLTDAAGGAYGPCRATFPASRPVRRIDRVYLGDGLAAERVVIPASTASDHRPVIVDIRRVG